MRLYYRKWNMIALLFAWKLYFFSQKRDGFVIILSYHRAIFVGEKGGRKVCEILSLGFVGVIPP